MKNLRSIKALFIVLMMFYTNHITAQSIYKNIPPNVITAFTAKYPGAAVKGWDAANNVYTAKATESGHKYFASFDQNGKWLMTTTKVNWPWHLPTVIKTAFKKSKYGQWNIYTVKIVEKPSGQFYQIAIDDRNHPIDALHNSEATENRLVEFKADGEFIKD